MALRNVASVKRPLPGKMGLKRHMASFFGLHELLKLSNFAGYFVIHVMVRILFTTKCRSSIGKYDMPKKSVLIVEDNEDVRDALAMLLQAEGFNVITAENSAMVSTRLGTLMTRMRRRCSPDAPAR